MLANSNASMMTTAFRIIDAANISSSMSRFSQCGVSSQGGVFYITNSLFYDYKSSFTYNYGIYGGVINAENSQIYLYQSTVKLNYAYKAGFAFLSSLSYLYANYIQF